MTTRRRNLFFERLKKALEEGIRFAKGELALRTTRVVNKRKKTGQYRMGRKKVKAS